MSAEHIEFAVCYICKCIVRQGDLETHIDWHSELDEQYARGDE